MSDPRDKHLSREHLLAAMAGLRMQAIDIENASKDLSGQCRDLDLADQLIELATNAANLAQKLHNGLYQRD